MQAKQSTFFRGPALFILPALVLYIFFLVIPSLGTVALTFFQWRGFSFQTLKFIGLQEYKEVLFGDPMFWQVFTNTLIFTGVAVALQCTVGLVIALLLEKGKLFVKIFRAAYFIPAIVSLLIISVVLDILFTPALGVLHKLLRPIHLEWLAGFSSWFADRQKAIYALALIQVWYGFGWSMFIFISGLKAINPELYEVARVDGASEWQRIIHITLPLLKGTASIAVLIATMTAIKVFELPYSMTRGGPSNATEVLSTWAYKTAFRFVQVGRGTTFAILLLILGCLLGFLIFKVTGMGKVE